MHLSRLALGIKNTEADRLARQLAQATGESLTEAVLQVLRERLRRQSGQRPVGEELARLAEEFSKLPVQDPRTLTRFWVTTATAYQRNGD